MYFPSHILPYIHPTDVEMTHHLSSSKVWRRFRVVKATLRRQMLGKRALEGVRHFRRYLINTPVGYFLPLHHLRSPISKLAPIPNNGSVSHYWTREKKATLPMCFLSR